MPLALRAFLGLLLALVPAGFVLVQMEHDARTERAVRLADQASQLLQRVAARQAATVGAARQLISAIAAAQPLQGDGCAAFLRRVLEANPRYLAVDLSDAEGRPACSSRADPPREPGLQNLLRADAFQLGAYQAGTPPAAGSLALAAPMRDGADRPTGAVVLTLSLDWLGGDLRSLGLPPDSTATIADRNGIVLASSHDAETRVGRALPGLAHRFLGAAAAGVEAVTGENGLRQLAYIPPDGGTGGLFLAVGLHEHPGATLLADRRVALMIVGALLLSFLLALLTFHVSAEGPVQALLSAGRRWSRQDWSARVGRIGGGRDFQRLASAFDGMAEAVETRQRAEARWQARMEAAPLLVLAADREGRVEWANAHWREVTGLGLGESRGDGWLAAVSPQDRPAVEAAWRAALADPGGAPLLQEMRLQGGHRCLLKGAPAVSAEGEVAWALFGLDVRELRQAEALADAADARLRAVYAHAPVGLCLLDRELRFLDVNERLARAHGAPLADHIGRRLDEIAPHFATELDARLRRLVETGEPVEDLEFCAETEGEERCWLCSYHPVRDRKGAVAAVSGAVVDITARRRMEDSARKLSQEVDHRAQNALSVVRGLLRLSAADAPDDVPALVDELEGRIGAMSRAHDVLSRENWLGADLGEIVVRELAAHPGRVEAGGPSVRLTAQAAQPLALTLNELVSNAQRHGALSGTGGHVALSWARTEDGAELRWVERGGPPIAGPPERIGFGSMLVDANMRTQLAGDVRRLWEPEGLTCILVIGAEALARESESPGLAEGPLAGRRVLLVEDDPVLALSIAATLREGGCDVLGPARSAAEAMFLAGQAGRVDVVVLAGKLGGRPVRQLAETLRDRAGVVLHLSPQGLKGRPVTPRGLREALAEALAAPREE
ncbi:PAS domain-containing protein [Roseococcus sp. SYP-B2431]|uniref:PAS domain-containing protein n=1 Tax=Roseococcus sp. SYP-B2431 TaxID=2496640 RepID=UPI0013F40D00|nr:PAS domain-containing protein [Roseococcus sp. SYP-B2431]